MNTIQFFILWGIVAVVALILIYVAAVYISANLVFGESEQQCIYYKGDHMLKLWDRGDAYGDCNWLVDKIIGNRSWSFVGGDIGLSSNIFMFLR